MKREDTALKTLKIDVPEKLATKVEELKRQEQSQRDDIRWALDQICSTRGKAQKSTQSS